MKKCKKCGRPLGNNPYCSVCDRDKLRAAKQKQQKKQENKSQVPWILGIIAAVCVVVAVVVTVILLVKGNADAPESASATESAAIPTDVGIHHCEIEIENYGTITVELDGDAAPITVNNFIKLANEGFYDGLTFHRIMNGFMMQGGDPNGNGSGGSGENIKGEFSANGVDNPLLHTRGAISMGRTSFDMNSASSQFFIVQQTSPHLDGQYACFGYVTDGMDIVDAICEEAQPVDNNGTIPADEQPVITAIRVID